MSQVVDAALSAPLARTLSKSSATSPLTSPENSMPGSPRPAAAFASDSRSDSRALSESNESASSPPPTAPTSAPHAPARPLVAHTQQGHVGRSSAPAGASSTSVSASSSHSRPSGAAGPPRRPSFGLSFLLSLSNSIRGGLGSLAVPVAPFAEPPAHTFMLNSPTIANLNAFTDNTAGSANGSFSAPPDVEVDEIAPPLVTRENTTVELTDITRVGELELGESALEGKEDTGRDKEGFFSVRLTPIIDHSSSNTGLYFSPLIRRLKPKDQISIGRYTEKNKSAAHAPQGLSAPIVFKSKVVLRTHALFQCNEDGLWFLKDCKLSSGTFLNNIRLSQASQELTLWPLIDGDVVQLGLDYRGGTEEVYRCVKMRCEFNRSWQRKVNRFNLDIHKKMKNLGLESKNADGTDAFSECAICLLKLEPCQALFISPCSHSWHYKCIRPIIIKSYPQFYCPNCRSMCDLETDIEDEE